MSGRGRSRNAVQFIQNDEPSFIKQFKERVGYKEGPSVDTKRRQLEYEPDEDAPENEDEQPIVVVLKEGDLTADEAVHAKKEQETTASSVDCLTTEGKITFKKPAKREGSSSSHLNINTAAKKKKKEGRSMEKSKSAVKQTKNSSLLSFDDDEDEND